MQNLTTEINERWYYCLTCERVWGTAAWRLEDWACPSSHDVSWPEYHPHIGWSHVRDMVGQAGPTEGGRVRLVPAGEIGAAPSPLS